MKKILVGLLLVTLGLLVTACGTTEAVNEPATPPPDTASPSAASPVAASPSASPEAATVGDAQSLETMDGGVVSVKLIATKRLPRVESYGIEMHPALFGVRLSLTNEGDSVYSDAVETCVTLIDAKGNAHEAVVPPISGKNANEIPGSLSLVKIAPGKKRSGWVYFKGGKALKPAQLQYTPDYGVGTQVGEWQLDAASPSADPTAEAKSLIEQVGALAAKSGPLDEQIGELMAKVGEIAPASANAADALPIIADVVATLGKMTKDEKAAAALWGKVAELDVGEESKTYAGQQKELMDLRVQEDALNVRLLAKLKTMYGKYSELGSAESVKLVQKVAEIGAKLNKLESRIDLKERASEQYFEDNQLGE